MFPSNPYQLQRPMGRPQPGAPQQPMMGQPPAQMPPEMAAPGAPDGGGMAPGPQGMGGSPPYGLGQAQSGTGSPAPPMGLKPQTGWTPPSPGGYGQFGQSGPWQSKMQQMGMGAGPTPPQGPGAAPQALPDQRQYQLGARQQPQNQMQRMAQ